MHKTIYVPGKYEHTIILLLCLLAAGRIFIFSAAFPFCNVVDEQAHFDLVVRYSQGDVPRSMGPPCAEALPFLAIFDDVEYLWPPESQPGGQISTPTWKLPNSVAFEVLRSKEVFYKTKMINVEAANPPLYYAAAGVWWRLGKLLGLDGGQLIYWLRFFNIPLFVSVVWLAWLTTRICFPIDIFIRVAVPALIAFMPQTTFYAINNDIFSPLTFGIVFLMLLKFEEAEIPTLSLAIVTGLGLGAVFLAKISNLPLLFITVIFLAVKFFALVLKGKARFVIKPFMLLAGCAGLPMGMWAVWCKTHFGDYTGTALKTQLMGWTPKPFAEWFHHPIFTPAGFWTFVSGNLATFWQGEILWHRKPLAIPALNWFYVLLTLVLLTMIFVALLKHPGSFQPRQREKLWLAFGFLTAAFGFYALLSVKLDFHDCFYPSREHPFFTSGRLMLGMLIPFMILFACGLDRALGKLCLPVRFVLLAILLLFMLVMEVVTDWQIFPNEYNWFHL
ncbi:MAG TPA: DUF2142 domain-containing protein [Verrucomicrobiae bacterium]